MSQTAPSPQILETLKNIVGDKNYYEDVDAQKTYLSEWRDQYHGRTPLILFPRSTRHVSQILKKCNETKTALITQGGNTGLVGGQIPDMSNTQIILNLTKMNALIYINQENNTIEAEAGITLHTLQKAAEEHDRLFPLSMASEGSCTLGGNLATNAGGTQVLHYGNIRALTLGLEYVLADGTIINQKQALHKDNAGYDLNNLIIGSEGTLGIITSAILKLKPKPRSQLSLYASFKNLHDVQSFYLGAQEAFAGLMTGFEIIPKQGMTMVFDHCITSKPPLSLKAPFYALLELSASFDEEILYKIAEPFLENALKKNKYSECVLAQNIAQHQYFWAIRHFMSEAQKHEGSSIKHDVSVPIDTIASFIKETCKALKNYMPDCRPVPFGHFGDGNIHFNVSPPKEMKKGEFLGHTKEINTIIHDKTQKYKGSIAAEHGIGQMKKDLLKTTKKPEIYALMQELKKTYDPNTILNPHSIF